MEKDIDRARKEYQKERDRISRKMRYYRGKGYNVNPLPKTVKQTMKTDTASAYEYYTKELQQYELNLYESVSNQGHTFTEYAPFYDIAIENYRKKLTTGHAAKGAEYVKEWFEQTLEKVGRQTMVDMMQMAENSGIEIDNALKYDETVAVGYISEMAKIFNDYGLLNKEETLDVLDNVSSLNEIDNIFDETGIYEELS